MEKIKRAYAFLAFTTFNCIVVFVIFNVVLGAMFLVRDRAADTFGGDARVSAYRQRFADYQAYASTPQAHVTALLDEQDAMGALGLQYEPWVQFRNPRVTGRFLNTDSRGFRVTKTPQARSGESLDVFMFGGSTTFGYGVADYDTIPSYLQRVLEKKHTTVPFLVRNFGQAYFYSSQEQLLLLTLLKNGDVPDWAVFVDGGNDTAQLALQHDEPILTPAVKRLWSNQVSGHGPMPLPIGRLVRAVATRLGRGSRDSATSAQTGPHRLLHSDGHLTEAERKKIADYVVSRYFANLRITRAVCREFGIQCLFIWQPHPAYKYNRDLHKTFPFEGPAPDYFGRVYSHLEKYRSPDFLFLGDLTENRTEKSYVDDVHYNETINEQVADRIAEMIRIDGGRSPLAGSKP